ncbi:hypothetical protein ACWDSJ_35735 [Nocardia sp. NPDC003482]
MLDAASLASVISAEGERVLASTAQDWVSRIRGARLVPDGDGTGKLPWHLVFPPKWWVPFPEPGPRPNELLVDPIGVLVAAGVTFSEVGTTIGDDELSAATDRAAQTLLQGAGELLGRIE